MTQSIPPGQPQDSIVVIDAEAAEAQRVEQSWHYAGVATGIWLCMSGFFFVRGYGLGAAVCTMQTLIMLGLMAWYRSRTGLRDRRRFTNLFLGLSCSVVFLVAVLHPELSLVLLFLPLGIVMAAQVLGVRGAFPWLVVNLAAFVSFEFLVDHSAGLFASNRIDGLILTAGVAIGTYLSALQSERLFRSRTASLLELSSNLHLMATGDSLTGLMNRHSFQARLDSSLHQAQADGSSVALLSIDLDDFKGINDTLGHPVGDETLREVAARLKAVAAPHSVYRLGGDEFCVLVPGLQASQSANDLAESIHETLTERYHLAGSEFQLGASIGVALYPEHAATAEALLAFADTALYHAKTNLLGVCGYQPELTEKLVALTTTKQRLSVALERDEFFLVYQPQVDMRTGHVVGVEALLRWRRDGQVVSPVDFIPVLERSRLILPVGRWLMREACRQLREWSDSGYDVRISVNVSVVQFQDEGFADSVTAAVEEFSIDPTRLDFEVTEGVLIDNTADAIERLTALKQSGATVSIDDFGTGYSSLAYLRQLPVDTLKIDREFVKDIPAGDDGTIASSIIALAKLLKLAVVAEGVETQEQLDFFKAQGCESFQGFLHSRPMAPTEVVSYLPCDNPVAWTFEELESAAPDSTIDRYEAPEGYSSARP